MSSSGIGNPRHAETPKCWIMEFQLNYIFSYNFGHRIKKLSANIHDLSANISKTVCKCRTQLEFSTKGFLQARLVVFTCNGLQPAECRNLGHSVPAKEHYQPTDQSINQSINQSITTEINQYLINLSCDEAMIHESILNK